MSDEIEAVDCRIVGLQEFFTLPAGTIFASWTPCIIGTTMVKGDTLYREDGTPIDFGESVLGADLYLGKDGVDYDRVVVWEIYGRWGLFDEDAQFIVYPPAAIRKIIQRLKDALPTGPEYP